MNINADYNKLLEESLKEELLWFEQEFKLIFEKKKSNYTKNEKEIANQLLDNLTEKINSYNNAQLLDSLAQTIERIEQKYINLL